MQKKKNIATKKIEMRERKRQERERLKKRSLKVGKNKSRAVGCKQCKLIYY